MEDQIDVNAVGRGFNLIHLNVRSLLGGHKFDMVRNQIENSNADIFSLSETWLTKAVPDRVIECMNYNVVRLDRNWNDQGNGIDGPKRGGGLSCFIKSSIKYSDTKFEALNKSCKDIEMLWVNIEINNMRPMVLVVVYRPPQGDCKKCNELLNEAFERANLKDNSDIFLMGDFNTNLADKNSIGVKELEFTTKALGLKQLVNSYTRIAFRNGEYSRTKLDLIFSNSEFIAEVKTLNYNISDHLAVVVTRKKEKVVKEKIDFKGRSYKNYDKQSYQNNLVNEDWGRFYEENNPNTLWDIYEAKILNQANHFCPIKAYKVKALREPWITNEAIEAIRDKDKLLQKAKKNRREADWVAAKIARNRVGRELENLRADFLKTQQENFRNDPEKILEYNILNLSRQKGQVLKDLVKKSK